jgi:hypothetical protein
VSTSADSSHTANTIDAPYVICNHLSLSNGLHHLYYRRFGRQRPPLESRHDKLGRICLVRCSRLVISQVRLCISLDAAAALGTSESDVYSSSLWMLAYWNSGSAIFKQICVQLWWELGDIRFSHAPISEHHQRNNFGVNILVKLYACGPHDSRALRVPN